jgi:hypothetical protein
MARDGVIARSWIAPFPRSSLPRAIGISAQRTQIALAGPSYCVSIRAPTSALADTSHDETISIYPTADLARSNAACVETANGADLYRSIHRDVAISATLDLTALWKTFFGHRSSIVKFCYNNFFTNSAIYCI